MFDLVRLLYHTIRIVVVFDEFGTVAAGLGNEVGVGWYGVAGLSVCGMSNCAEAERKGDR